MQDLARYIRFSADDEKQEEQTLHSVAFGLEFCEHNRHARNQEGGIVSN